MSTNDLDTRFWRALQQLQYPRLITSIGIRKDLDHKFNRRRLG